MSPGFNLADYEPVEDRIEHFWKEYPKGRISTRLLEAPEGSWVIFAEIYRDIADEFPAATGMAQEVINSSPVNRTSALENCETSAIGRALANLGYAAKGKRPSREEMSKAQKQEPPTAKPPQSTRSAQKQPPAVQDEPSAESDFWGDLAKTAGLSKVLLLKTVRTFPEGKDVMELSTLNPTSEAGKRLIEWVDSSRAVPA